MNDESEDGGGHEDDQRNTQSARDLRLESSNNDDRYTREDNRPQRVALRTIPPNVGLPRPNGSRLSCGRRARGRKAVEQQIEKLASEAAQFFLACERSAASRALGGETIRLTVRGKP